MEATECWSIHTNNVGIHPDLKKQTVLPQFLLLTGVSQCLRVSKQWYDCQCLGIFSRRPVSIHVTACTRGVYEQHKRVCAESWLWQKNPLPWTESNLHQLCAWLFTPLFDQLSHIQPCVSHLLHLPLKKCDWPCISMVPEGEFWAGTDGSIVDRFYSCSTSLCSRADSLGSCQITSEWLSLFTVHFWTAIKAVYSQRCLVVTWLVPRETAAISVRILCTPYSHAPVYSVMSFKATYVRFMCV